MQIRAVLFDFEGTRVDFQWRLGEAEAQLRQACAARGFSTAGNYAELWNAAADVAAAQSRLDEVRRALGPIYDRWDADALRRAFDGWALLLESELAFDAPDGTVKRFSTAIAQRPVNDG